MSDDFAAKGGLAALSADGDLGLLEPMKARAAAEPFPQARADDDLDYDDLAPPSHYSDPTYDDLTPPSRQPDPTYDDLAPPSHRPDPNPQRFYREPSRSAQVAAHAARPIHDGLIIHVCRGAGGDDHLDALLHALTQNGWAIDTSLAHQAPLSGVPGSGIEPGAAAFNDGNIHVALGSGLGGARAMWQGWDARLRRVDGVVAVCPFLGFDSPLSRNSAKRVGRLHAKAFALAGRARWRPIAERVECASGYTGLAGFVSEPISWADIADCTPYIEFSQLMGHLVCPTAIILDAEDAELDAPRAMAQIPAMSVLASVDVRPLVDGGLLHAVEHALYQIIRYHQEGQSHEAPAAFTPLGKHPV